MAKKNIFDFKEINFKEFIPINCVVIVMNVNGVIYKKGIRLDKTMEVDLIDRMFNALKENAKFSWHYLNKTSYFYPKKDQIVKNK